MSDITDILSIEGNNVCVDCGKEGVEFVSINNAVFLCNDCQEGHSSLFEFSTIKLLTDNFSSQQLKQLEIGGNQRFLKNLSDFGIIANQGENLNKYLYKASEYYRNLIVAEMTNSEPPSKISLNEAQEILQVNENKVVSPKKKSGQIGAIFNKAASIAKSSIKSTEEKIKNLHIKDKIKSTGQFISSGASKIAVSVIV